MGSPGWQREVTWDRWRSEMPRIMAPDDLLTTTGRTDTPWISTGWKPPVSALPAACTYKTVKARIRQARHV